MQRSPSYHDQKLSDILAPGIKFIEILIALDLPLVRLPVIAEAYRKGKNNEAALFDEILDKDLNLREATAIFIFEKAVKLGYTEDDT